MKILFTGCHYCYTIFGIARFLRRYRFAPCRKQKYVIKDKRSHRIRRNAASLSFHSMISRDSYPPRRVCPYSHTLCSPSIPESCNHCTEAHILTRSYSDSSCSEQLSRQLQLFLLREGGFKLFKAVRVFLTDKIPLGIFVGAGVVA